MWILNVVISIRLKKMLVATHLHFLLKNIMRAFVEMRERIVNLSENTLQSEFLLYNP